MCCVTRNNFPGKSGFNKMGVCHVEFNLAREASDKIRPTLSPLGKCLEDNSVLTTNRNSTKHFHRVLGKSLYNHFVSVDIARCGNFLKFFFSITENQEKIEVRHTKADFLHARC